MRKSLLKSSRTSVSEFLDPNLKQGYGSFTFPNGDSYEGEYKFHFKQLLLVKHGSGIYTTDDFNIYDGKWNNDKIAENEIHIRSVAVQLVRGKKKTVRALTSFLSKDMKTVLEKLNCIVHNQDHSWFKYPGLVTGYNNGAQYKGGVDGNGTMSGTGIYIFPDGSSIQAIWLENKPFQDIIYRDPCGFPWTVENVTHDTISFTAGNHFWDDMNGPLLDESMTYSTDSNTAN